ncbi:MAG: hypothetical protein J6L89_00860 [Clostridia bacterium]|nr:hypothetical protein [Clostridia bacterium]
MKQTVKVNSRNITFEKEKTSSYQKANFSACTCEGCSAFRKAIESNKELSAYLEQFGIDYNFPDEVFWYDMGEDDALYYESDGYYGVCGFFDGDEFSFEKYGVTISFLKNAMLPVERDGEYFYISIKGDFPPASDDL